MSYELYKVLHLTGLFFLFTAFGGMLMHVLNGGTRDFAFRKWVAMLHGIGLFLLLIAGFGLAARLQLMGSLPGWIYAKLIIWLILGGMPVLIYRKQAMTKALWGLVIFLGALAAYLAIYKPF